MTADSTYNKMNNLGARAKYDSRRSAPRTDVSSRKSAKQAMADDMHYKSYRSKTPMKDTKSLVNVSDMVSRIRSNNEYQIPIIK